jgi:hypothetical protein
MTIMSHRERLEQVLELLINEEHDAASELLHSVIVEKARGMYEELVDEDFGGDEKEDFADEIESDKEEIEADEIFDDEDEEEDEDGDEEDSEEPAEEEEVEDRLEDVEASLAELRAEFDALMADEMDEPEHADLDVEMDGELDGDIDMEPEMEGMYEEDADMDLEEATKLQDEQKADMGSEGKLAGTGNKSKVGATGKESMFTRAPSKADHGGKPHATGVGGDESGMKAGQGSDHTPEDNIDVPQKKQSAKAEVKDDKGAKSTLGSKGAPKGA